MLPYIPFTQKPHSDFASSPVISFIAKGSKPRSALLLAVSWVPFNPEPFLMRSLTLTTLIYCFIEVPQFAFGDSSWFNSEYAFVTGISQRWWCRQCSFQCLLSGGIQGQFVPLLAIQTVIIWEGFATVKLLFPFIINTYLYIKYFVEVTLWGYINSLLFIQL